MSPTFEASDAVWRAYFKLPTGERVAFRRARDRLIAGLRERPPTYHPSLRVKRHQASGPGVATGSPPAPVAVLTEELQVALGVAATQHQRDDVVPTVSCRDGGRSPAPVKGRDVSFGPLSVLFARRTPRTRRDAFDGRGWKLPVNLSAGRTATLSVPQRLRGQVGLIFNLSAQSRVLRRGVQGADSAVRFTACTSDERPGRTGWPGGIVVKRERCATLRVRIEGRPEPVERRVALGKRCI